MATDGVKEELAAMQIGESEDVTMTDAEENDAGVVTLDKVSLLQESVDKMTLSMFNALRLLPASTDDNANNQETKDAITSLANDVLRMVQETDVLIDDLPGLDKTEAEQLEELRRLQIQSEEEAQTLRQVAEEADIYGGRVLAGEDSEEDDDDEEEMNFQFNGFGSQQSPAAPRFAVPTVVAPPVGAEDGEDEESEEEEEEQPLKLEEKPLESKKGEGQSEEVTEGEKLQDETEEVKTVEVKQPLKEAPVVTEENAELWQVDESVNGIEVMSNAVIDTIQPSLDATIHRIAELKESQQRLLKLLAEQNAAIGSSKQIEDVAVVLEKLPYYVKKVQGIKLAMAEISTSTEKMKRRAENLRVDAQSHAIKKENKRDAQSQWNKLYAAKNAGSPSVQS
ncbi:hypothetical protein BBO99_00008747 [Phytophthora kernoviae]|uniref:Mediator of RNA polymerase II transcription subunit 21 n=1 Tax=Phytophthora kernoviae TaxID=325452 RepID=A0A421GE69_9STRA|nr:hypothetical protein BBI17_008765 [Phytophthora kernoviae]RLN74789.1 hypothetical protein BBO99_00008747 [Phytophthora kernoviae]